MNIGNTNYNDILYSILLQYKNCLNICVVFVESKFSSNIHIQSLILNIGNTNYNDIYLILLQYKNCLRIFV